MKKIIITGGSGFLGTQIINKLLSIGEFEIVIIDIFPPRQGKKNVSFFKKNLAENFDQETEYPELKNPFAVIHLAGKSIFGRFTDEHKQAIWDSRVNGSRHLVNLLKRKSYKPQSLVAASAVGFYGNQPGEVLVESSERKNYYFLSDVVKAWDEENLQSQEYGINVTCIRNGHIIGKGGILAVVASMFNFGVGGILGSGSEYFPWIDIRDLVDLYVKCAIDNDSPLIINGVSTTSETQEDFARAIGAIKNTKFYINIREWMLSLKFGDFAQEMLVNQHVQSEYYQDIPFTPEHTNLPDVVAYYLKQN
jgi:uncharacterized protein (TIGR01777 family)